jgi:heme exporter protein C
MNRMDRAIRWLAGATVLATVTALAFVYRAPDEVFMGSSVDITYVHVGAAWTAYLSYALTALGAGLFLIKRAPKWDQVAVAAAELGVVLTTITLVTGSLFGRVVSNWWWNWGDVRLVVTLLLWFLYAAYLLVRQVVPGNGGRTVGAVLALLGVPLMVVNHFAVTWWQRAHPPSVILNPAGPAMDAELLVPFAVSQVAFVLVFATLILARIRLEAERDEPSLLGWP